MTICLSYLYRVPSPLMWAVEDADTGVTEAWVRRFKTNMELKGRGLMFIELFVPQIKKKKISACNVYIQFRKNFLLDVPCLAMGCIPKVGF